MQQPIDLPKAALAPLSVVDAQSAGALGRACARDAHRAGDFWSVWRDGVLRAAPFRDGAEEEAFRRLAAGRALKTDS